MPQYAISTAQGLRPLGKFDDIEQVKKLRMFKDNPALINRVEVVVERVKPVFKSNRWRLIYTRGSNYYDVTISYTWEEVNYIFRDMLVDGTVQAIIYVPKYAYHGTDDSEFS